MVAVLLTPTVTVLLLVVAGMLSTSATAVLGRRYWRELRRHWVSLTVGSTVLLLALAVVLGWFFVYQWAEQQPPVVRSGTLIS